MKTHAAVVISKLHQVEVVNAGNNTQCNRCQRIFISTPAGKGNCPDCSSSDVRKYSKSNALDWPKEYVCNFLEPGLVSYEDVGAGIAMLPSETIDGMLQSFVGKPVIIDHADVTPENMAEFKHGTVTRVWRDGNWAWCAFILDTDESKKKVEKGYSVSCAFDVLEVGPGGEHHAIKFDERIQRGSFTHLALVTNPRYEGCRIYTNSKGAAKIQSEQPAENKTKENQTMIKWPFSFRKKENGKESTLKVERDPASIFVNVAGVGKVSMKDLVEAQNSAGEETLTLEDTFEDDKGNKHSVSELVAHYRNSKGLPAEGAAGTRQNASEEEEEDRENGRSCSCSKKPKHNAKPEDHEVECAVRKNADEEDKGEDAEDKSKKNARPASGGRRDPKFHAAILSAREGANAPGFVGYESTNAKVARGAERYGSKQAS